MALVAAVGLVLWILQDIVLLIFMAVLIAVMLRGVSDWVARWTGTPQLAMLAFVSTLVAATTVGFVYYIGPRLMAETQALWGQLRDLVDHLRDAYGDTAWGRTIFQNLSPPETMQGHLVNYAGSVATSTIGGATTTLLLIVTALYFAIAPELYIGGVIRLFPLHDRARARIVLREIGVTLRRWSLGQVIDMCVVGVLVGIGLILLGVPLELALAVLAGLLTFVPYFGAIAAAIPAVLVAFTIDWQTALWVAGIFLLGHSIDSYIVSPLVQKNTANLPPALTILSMTVLGSLFGALGVILGAPVAAALLVLVREVYVGDVLGDPDVKRSDAA